MLFVAIILDPRYRLKYVKFWFKEWYRKDKGDAMSSKVRDALKRLYVERVGQNVVSSSSGSGSGALMSRAPGQVLVMFHCLIALKVIMIGLSNTCGQGQCGKQI